MLKQTIEILTSYKKPKKVCVMGNVAVARGAIEAGVSGVFSYPGTPSTEISEVFNYVNDFQSKEENEKKFPKQTAHKIYFEYSINEKIALEKAIAYSIGNKKAMCVMKNVGMNVASDALMSIAYQTIVAPLVIIICDDPGCFSSSNEQDSRYWGKFASIPMLNPATPEDACSMTFEAFSISEKLKLPVIVRMTTRVDHSRGVIEYSEIKTKEDKAHFDRLPQHINIPARTAAAHKVLLEKFNNELFSISNRKNNYLVSENKKSPIAIIAGGVATVYAQELLSRIPKSKNIPVLKLGVLHPFPESDVLKFLKRSFKKVLVLEELDPLVENEVRIVTQKNKIKTEILGKGFEGLSSTGEYTLDILCNALEKFTGQTLRRKNQKLIEGAGDFLSNISPRPPVLCAGCPHRSTFYALKLAIPRDDGKIIMCGDIGCFGLGALPPLQMIDTINHMGMSVSMAQGLSEALRLKTEQGKIVALLGDGTFFHSGVASLINAIYTRANITVIIFDNRTIGMTGHQDHPGATHERSKYKQIDIYSLVKGLGVELVENINPFELHDTYDKVKNAIGHQGVSVLIAKSPCIFLPDFKDGTFVKKSVRVNPDKCNTCFNHCDMSIACSREQSPKGNLVRARAKITAGEHIFGQEQLCPANICNHGFFNSILSGNYKEALEIVRDKMLFARVCGDICHRPCESLFRMENGSSVPIKKLKKIVSSMEDNFMDFSRQRSRALASKKKNKNIAVIGAGPAGLSSAYDLVQNGYGVTVFEKQSSAGGMIASVIPDFRMDKVGMKNEIAVLNDMGVKFKFNTSLGKDIALEDLSKKFDSVILAVGMWQVPPLEIVENNISLSDRFDAISFLQQYNLKKLKLKPAANVLVIGGGNSAMDAARAAKQFDKKNNVIISCIETEDKMPAFKEEVKHALADGIQLNANSFVDAIAKENGRYEILLRSFDKKEVLEKIEVDYVITAIGQKGDPSVLNENIETDSSSRIKLVSGYTNVFAAGDILAGNHISLIGAIGSGKRAAVQVRKLLEDYKFEYEGETALNKLTSATGSELSRSETDNLNPEDIFNYDLYQPCAKCDHCIENFGCPAMVKVDGKIVIDDARCNRCGLCIDVCPNGAVEMIEEVIDLRK